MIGTAQPNASRLDADLLERVLGAVDPGQSWPPREVQHRDRHSNDFAEVRLTDGRALVVKRARYAWAYPRFSTSRIASRLMRDRAAVTAPAPLPLPDNLRDPPIEAYWRIDKPTLQELWPSLDRRQRREALRSWGRLARRIHDVRLEGFGPLSDPSRTERTLVQYLVGDLEVRLLPAVYAEWPTALKIVERLVREVPDVAERAGASSRLVHNDLHMGNILCEHGPGGTECTGVVDLEGAMAAPPESDVALMQVQHGPFFGQRLRGKWFDRVREGYGAHLDEIVIRFLRVLHLINMGFYSALVGHRQHAGRVAGLARKELDRG